MLFLVYAAWDPNFCLCIILKYVNIVLTFLRYIVTDSFLNYTVAFVRYICVCCVLGDRAPAVAPAGIGIAMIFAVGVYLEA